MQAQEFTQVSSQKVVLFFRSINDILDAKRKGFMQILIGTLGVPLEAILPTDIWA